MTATLFAEIIGTDLIWVILIIAVLFGGSQIPKLARNLGSAQREFKKGLAEGANEEDKSAKPDQ